MKVLLLFLFRFHLLEYRKEGAVAAFRNQTDLFIRLQPWRHASEHWKNTIKVGDVDKFVACWLDKETRKRQIQAGAIRVAVLSRDTAFREPKEMSMVGRLRGGKSAWGAVWD